MIRVILRRIPMALLVALTVSILGFALLRLSGDLVRELAGDTAGPEQLAEVARAYGLDKPLPIQYLNWLWDLLRGDFGTSLFTGEAVSSLIATRAGPTIILALASLVVAVAIGVPLGVLAAANPNTFTDRLIAVVAVFGQAVPNFWFGLVMLVIFAVKLKWLPVAGDDTAAHFVLPVITLALSIMPQFVRVTRSGVLDAMGADYIRTARSKGIPTRRLYMRHALRNAILPVVSLSAVTLGFLLGGSVIVESVFSINGLGLLAYSSILSNDFPVVQAIVVIVSIVYVFLTLLSDAVNAWIDPRLRG
ncbi:ABC transporter permease [Maritimibacter sp. UBA3975]|uniref:ABC transporter permease n=1 Tax=Maritimibacter sp. UBA3975 TaxID=1946833 RepID=UPI000C09C9DC|nr:ABC transporter permease [Maritimibacter sp. UBA3975]MAM62349.1 ABC transporter permease [Maritimibacter sp.]